MKLKYIFASIVATLALAVSCQKEADHYLDEIKVSSSFVSLSTGVGANTSITVTATDSWTIAMTGKKNEWLTISPTTGGPGETVVTFSASAGEGRTEEVIITCGDKKQHIKVIQGVAQVSNATCAEIIAGPDSKTYRVTGVCTAITNTTYGNWLLKDDTGEITIYGTLDKNGGTKNFLSLGIEVGDEITVEGPKTTYGSTIELVDVTVLNINKSLIKVEDAIYPNPEGSEILPKYLPVEGGEVFVALVNKGETLKVTIPEEAQSWLGICEINGPYVTFKANPNEGGDRETTVTFGTTQGNKAYSCQLTIPQKGAVVAASVAEFIAAEVGSVQYRLTGVISKAYPSDKQGQSFYIKDWSGEVLVYRTDNFKESALEIGDVCSVVGKRGEYQGTAQMVNGTIDAVVEIVNEADIPTVLAATDGDWFRVTGTIKSIANPTYGNMTITDGTNDLFIYGVYPGYGATGDNRKNLVEKLGLKEGDTITVFGAKATKNNEAQISNGLYWSHESAGEGGGEGGDTDEVFAKVTAAPESWAGDYLIVWNGEAHATASNKDLAKTIDVTITDGVISATDAVKAAAVKVAAIEGGYSITLPDGKFLTFTTNSNQCTFADAAAPMNFEVTETGVKVSGKDEGGNTRFLMENPNNGNAIYRGYKESSFIVDGAVKEGWAYPTLYKLTALD